MAIFVWQSENVLNPFFRFEGHLRFNEAQLSLDIKIKDTNEQAVITLSVEEIKDLANILGDFSKKMEKDIQEMEKGSEKDDLNT